MADFRSDRWRFATMVPSIRDAILHGGFGSESIDELLYHALGKAFHMGLDEHVPCERIIPVTDLTDVPEIWNNIRERWEDGHCH